MPLLMMKTDKNNILVIDNIDSFVYNLVQYVGDAGANPIVFRNTAPLNKIRPLIDDDKIRGVIISPGPKTPADAGISNDVIEQFGKSVPLLGVCLGHQCIGYSFGAKIRHAKTLKHGKVSSIGYTPGSPLFKGIPNPFTATRYHSLVVDDPPPDLKVTATSLDDSEIMALEHRVYPIFGVQFHPESILTRCGMKIIKNFLSVCSSYSSRS